MWTRHISSFLTIVLCFVVYQQCLAQNTANINEIVRLMAPLQDELMTTAVDVLRDLVTGNGTNNTVSENCLNDAEAWLDALIRREYWAVRMIDAMGKPPSGLQDFHITWLGGWEECLSVEGVAYQDPIYQNGTTRHIGTQYCLGSLPVQGAPVTQGIKPALTIGFCVPESCLKEDSTSLFNVLIDLIPLNLTSMVETPATVTCQEKELEYTTQAKVAIAMCGCFALVMAIATLYDIFIQKTQNKNVPADQMTEEYPPNSKVTLKQTNHSNGHTTLEGKTNCAYVVTDHDIPTIVNGNAEKPHPKPIVFTQTTYTPGLAGKLLLSFSVYTNAPKILSFKQSAGTLTAVNGIRFISMTWVMLGHTFGFGQGGGVVNMATYAAPLMKRFTFMAIENATVSVDTFFLLSGLLVSYLSLKEMKKVGGAKRFRWGLYYFHRYWRLTPPYMLCLFVFVTTFKYCGDGPMWPQQGLEQNECRDSWWLNMLYINNFFGRDKLCYAWSWYLTNDMQFYVISPLMLIPLYHLPVLGVIICLALIGVNFVTAGVIAYTNELKANLMLDTGDPFDIYYMKPYTRIGPYVVGFLLGYILYKTELKPKLTKLTNMVGWLLATAFALTILYGLYTPDGTEHLNHTTAAIYVATHRTVWGACVAWVIYACATGFGGPVNALLSWEGILPLSRLTYCAYLIHPIVMYAYNMSHRALVNWYDLQVSYEFLGHVCMTYAAAFVVSLAFESPMMGLEKVLLGKKKKS